MRKKSLLPIIIAMFLLTACERNPVSKLVNPVPTDATGVWGGQWIVYDDELKTGGTVMSFNSMDGQILDLDCSFAPYSGSKCIKYMWDGSNVYTYDIAAWQDDWCGFSLIAADNTSAYNIATRDLTNGAYTKLSFWAKGELNNHVSFRVESNNGTSTSLSGGPNAYETTALSTSWQKYVIDLTGSQALTKDFIKIIFKYDDDGKSWTNNTTRGNGGTVYIDDIVLTQI